jgi:hypothetical protein
MDGLREFLGDLRRHGYAQGNFLGLLHVLLSRRIETAQGTLISNGLTWRVLAEWLKRVRWDKEAAREVGVDPATLPPRDRLRYWFLVIALAGVDTAAATRAGQQLSEVLRLAGYQVGPGPGETSSPASEVKL